MAKIPNGILGAFSGTLGPSVGSTWKDIKVVRSRPPRKRRKSTEGQLRQMAKLALMTKFVHPLTGLLNKTYHSVTVRMSCFNKALSYNMRNAVDGEYPAFTINYARIQLGAGDLLHAEKPVASSPSQGTLAFSWTDNSGAGSALATDQAFAAAYCEDLADWLTSDPGVSRKTGGYTLDVTAFSGKKVQTYLGFLSADGKYVSTSLYTGMVNIL